MKRDLVITLSVIVALVLAVFGYRHVADSKESQYFKHMKPPSIVVSTIVATKKPWKPFIESVGNMHATQGINLPSTVSGTITGIHFNSGEYVSSGTPLVEVNHDVESADLESFKAQLYAARLDYKRQKSVYDSDRAISKMDLDTTKANYEKLKAQVESAQAQVNLRIIRAPFSGRVGIKQVTLGQYVSPGFVFTSLHNTDPIRADYTLPEKYLTQVALGQTVTASIDSYPGHTFTGKITALDSRIGEKTKSYAIQAEFPNHDKQHIILPGMLAEIHTLLPTKVNPIVIPQQAIMYTLYGDSVFVVKKATDADDTLIAKKIYVKTDDPYQGSVVVTSGLKAGDQVIIAGQYELSDGTVVTIKNKQVS